MEHDASHSAPGARQHTSDLADQIVDELLPADLDWRQLVRNYPFPVVILAALVGLILGRQRGHFLLTALGGFAMHQATENIASALERAGLGFPTDDPASSSADRDA